MKHRTGVLLPSDLKTHSWTKINNEDLRELARTILAALFMVIAIYFCFLTVATAPDPDYPAPVARNEDGAHAGLPPVSVRLHSRP